MTVQIDVALVATVHDPENRLLRLVRASLPALKDLYPSISVLCSAATHHELFNLLEKSGVMVRKEGRPRGVQNVGAPKRPTPNRGAWPRGWPN